MKLLIPAKPDFDSRPAKVERWYDRRTKCWVVTTTNAAGDQLGDATYVHSKREALLDEKWRLGDIAAGMTAEVANGEATSLKLGDLRVVGNEMPPAKLLKALAVIADSLHPLFDMVPALETGKSKRSCVLVSLAIRDFLFRVGFRDAEVVPVLMYLHARREDGEVLHTLGIGDPDHNVARAQSVDGKRKHWAGHMVVRLPKIGWLIDGTLYQAHRPQYWSDLPGMMAVQMQTDHGTEFFGLYPIAALIEKDDDKIVTALWLDQPRNKFWRDGGDSIRRRREAVVDALVEQFGAWRED